MEKARSKPGNIITWYQRYAAVLLSMAALAVPRCRAFPTINGSSDALENAEVFWNPDCNYHMVPILQGYHPQGAQYHTGYGELVPQYVEGFPYPICFWTVPPLDTEYARESYEREALYVYPTAPETLDGVGPATELSGYSERLGHQENVPETNAAITAARQELDSRAPCVQRGIKSMDYGVVQVTQCAVALGLWGDDAVQISRLVTRDTLTYSDMQALSNGDFRWFDLDHIHTLRLSLTSVRLIRGKMIDEGAWSADKLAGNPNSTMMALAAQAVPSVVLELGKLSQLASAIWVQLPGTPYQLQRRLIDDDQMGRVVNVALQRLSISVLTLQMLETHHLSQKMPRTWERICKTLGSTGNVKVLEFYHPAAPSTHTVRTLYWWPFCGLDWSFRHYLTKNVPGRQWRDIDQLSFMYPHKARLDTRRRFGLASLQSMLGGASPVRTLALFFNVVDMGDAVRVFMPLASGYFDGTLGKLTRLLVHAVTHVMYLLQLNVNLDSQRWLRPELQAGQGLCSAAVVHYLPKLGVTTTAQRSAMLEHLAVVLPRVHAATVQVPLQLCEVNGKFHRECVAAHCDAAKRLRTTLEASPSLMRLKMDYFWASEEPPKFSPELDVPWYAQALADVGAMPQLRMLSIRSHVSDAERGQHLVRILQNNPQLSILKLFLLDRIVFEDDFAPQPREAGPACVVRGIFDEAVPPVLEPCLRARYEPLISALQASRIWRIDVRVRLTHRVPGEIVPRHVQNRRNRAAIAIEDLLAQLFINSAQADVKNYPVSGLFTHRRLPQAFAIESNVDRMFPALNSLGTSSGWMSYTLPERAHGGA